MHSKVSLTTDDIKQLKRTTIGDVPYSDRISLGFLLRLICHQQDHPYILREINVLEGHSCITNTKAAEAFKHPPLRPFWHKHFYAPRHFVRNIGIRWGLDNTHPGNRDFEALTVTSTNAAKQKEDWIALLTHQLVLDGISERASLNRLTGDWIIFAKHDGKNYYLDLASHSEARDNPTALMNKIRAGSHEDFPFLFQQSTY